MPSSNVLIVAEHCDVTPVCDLRSRLTSLLLANGGEGLVAFLMDPFTRFCFKSMFACQGTMVPLIL